MEKLVYVGVGVLATLLIVAVVFYPVYSTQGYTATGYGEEMKINADIRVLMETRTLSRYILLINDTPTFLIKIIAIVNVEVEKVENITVSMFVHFQHELYGDKDLGYTEQFKEEGGTYVLEMTILASVFVDRVFGGYHEDWNNTQGYLIIDITANGWGKVSNRIITTSTSYSVLFNLSYVEEKMTLNVFAFGFILGALGVELIRKRYGIEIA